MPALRVIPVRLGGFRFRVSAWWLVSQVVVVFLEAVVQVCPLHPATDNVRLAPGPDLLHGAAVAAGGRRVGTWCSVCSLI